MAHPDRLTALDATFLHIETGAAHMHVASIMVFEGEPPSYDEVLAAFEERLHLVPRYRQKLAWVPFDQGRPMWVDDPHFNLGYHVRHSALPSPGSDEQLAALGGRLFAVGLDRHKPLWEIHLVEGLAPGHDGTPRFALLAKTHHALVDGVSGVDITSVLFSTTPDPMPVGPPATAWSPRPEPSSAQLLAQALLERASSPAEGARGVRALGRHPRTVVRRLTSQMAAAGTMAWAGLKGAPETPLNVPIGPHRRYGWVDTPLELLKGVKNGLGGTVNDAVLTAVSPVARPLPAAARRRDGRARAQGARPRLRARHRSARRAREQGLGDVGTAPDGPGRPGRLLRAHPHRDGRPEGVEPGRRSRGPDRAGGLRARRRSSARPRACRPVSASSTSS